MRTEQILYLSEIHRTSSLHRASENLHISVQSLSLSINTLEKEFGLMLVNRSRHGSVLTSEGLKLLDAGIIFLETIAEIKGHQMEQYPHLHHADIELLVADGMMETYFPSLAAKFYEDFPTSKIKTQKLPSDTILEQLSSQQQVAFISCLYINQEQLKLFNMKAFEKQTVLTGKYFCLAHDKLPIACYGVISLKTMSKYPCLIYSPSRNVLDALLNFSGDTKKAIYIDDFSVFSQMIRQGAGASFISVLDHNSFVSETPYKVIPFKEKIHFDVNFVYKKNAVLSPAMREFIAYAQNFYLNYGKFLSIKY